MKSNYNILVVESSEIIFEGLSKILKESDERFNFLRVDCLKEASEILKSTTFQLIIINSAYFYNNKNAKLKIQSMFSHHNVIALISTNMDRGICSSFTDCIYMNDDKETIRLVLKKHLQTSNGKIEVNNEVLSEREIDVLKLLVRGYANKEIAEELFISTHTVVSHRKNISKKIGMKSTAAMAIYAAANNIIDIDTVLKSSK